VINKLFQLHVATEQITIRKDYTICTAAKTYEIGQNRLKLAE